MKIARELPNILCFFRIFVSVFIAMLLTPPGEIVGLIYSVAFITDLLDGYVLVKGDGRVIRRKGE